MKQIDLIRSYSGSNSMRLLIIPLISSILLNLVQSSPAIHDPRSHENSVSHDKKSSNEISCNKRLVQLARQALNLELEEINDYNFIWFSDITKEEIYESQRSSMSKLISLGKFNSNDLPVIEIEASYFKPSDLANAPNLNQSAKINNSTAGSAHRRKITYPMIELRHNQADICTYDPNKRAFTYKLGLSISPIEQYFDLVFNYPREIKRSQPNDWTYSNVALFVPKLFYQVTLKQDEEYTLTSNKCPLEVIGVVNVPISQIKSPILVRATNMAQTNETKLALERLFSDFTLPAVTERLRELLEFHLSSKTLPLSVKNSQV